MGQVDPPSPLPSAPRQNPMSRRSTKRLRPNPRVYQEDSPSPAADPSTPTVDEATASSPKASVSDADVVRLARRSAIRMRPNPRVYQEDCPSPTADPSTPTVDEATASSPKASVSDADTVRLARSMALTQLVELTPSEATTAGPLAKATEGPKPPAASYDSWGLCLWI